jgi:hypothetical protein
MQRDAPPAAIERLAAPEVSIVYAWRYRAIKISLFFEQTRASGTLSLAGAVLQPKSAFVEKQTESRGRRHFSF